MHVQPGRFPHDGFGGAMVGGGGLFGLGLGGLQHGSQGSGALDEVLAGGVAGGRVGFEGGGDIGRRFQGFGEGDGVFGGFGDAGAEVGAGDEGGVAEEGDAAVSHGGTFEVVDRLQKGGGGGVDHGGKLGGEAAVGVGAHGGDEGGADEGRWDAKVVAVAGDVGEEVGEGVEPVGGAIPDEVVAAVAWAEVIVGAGDGVAEDLLAFGKAESEVAEEVGVGLGGDVGLGD